MLASSIGELPYTGDFYATKFSQISWIIEIKFVKCRNVIASYISSYIGKNTWVHENLNADIYFLKNSWKCSYYRAWK